MRNLVFILTLFISINTFAQDFTTALFNSYEKYREGSIDKRRIKHEDILPLLQKLNDQEGISVTRVGTSIEGRSLNLVSLGKGETNVFLWSQMHGDESTATMAIFDILNFFLSDEFKKEKSVLLSNLSIHFLPMLNPDGAERFTRRNRLGVDINRDALRLQSPESRTLKRVRDSLQADFGFNLHDQSRYYNAKLTEKPATISYLAPAYNYEKDINEVRGNAMKVIVLMNNVLQKFVPGQVGRYNDDFEPRAFGDNIQKWGTSTILIESGGNYEDREKQIIRKLNFVSILTAMNVIASDQLNKVDRDAYFEIPNNDRKLFDLKIKEVGYDLLGKQYLLDLGFYKGEIDNEDNSDFFYAAAIGDQGDLSTYYGYKTIDGAGYQAIAAKVFPDTLNTIDEVKQLDMNEVIGNGYGFVRVKELPEEQLFTKLPITVISESYEPSFDFRVGANPSFFLSKDGKPFYYIVNGFLVDLRQKEPFSNISNTLIYR